MIIGIGTPSIQRRIERISFSFAGCGFDVPSQGMRSNHLGITVPSSRCLPPMPAAQNAAAALIANEAAVTKAAITAKRFARFACCLASSAA
jgi:hypothetical protein